MEFVLQYRGSLKSNAGPKHKHAIRCCIHDQLSVLSKQAPLRDILVSPNAPPPVPVGDFEFQPLVRERWRLIADLDIIMLRPEAHGSLITHGGDIDNRLKTPLDALRMPQHQNELASGEPPKVHQSPFFCLLEDDNLITGIRVRTEQLLELDADNNKVILLIRVRTKKTTTTWENLSL